MAQTPQTKTHFLGGLQSGLATGNPGTDTRGAVILNRTVTVSAASSANITVPGDASNFGFRVVIVTGSAGTGGEVKFGTTTDSTAFAAFTGVSAAGLYTTPSSVSAANLANAFGSDRVMVIRGSAANVGGNAMIGTASITYSRG